ncbi:MAG TPA: hypothetical protein VL463_33355, partial [Kofleriaceae bacterium]|nr:hypothetical protein [Kofleriaceae bacterium]
MITSSDAGCGAGLASGGSAASGIEVTATIGAASIGAVIAIGGRELVRARADVLARAALAAGGGFAASHLLGQVLSELGHREEAAQVLADAAEHADESVTEEARAQLAVTRSDNLFWGLADYAGADAILEEAERTVTDPGVSAQL